MTDGIGGELGRELGAIKQMLADMGGDVAEIKEQTTRTNGRVTALETHNEVEDARRRALAEAEHRRTAARERMQRLLMWALGTLVAIFGGAFGAMILGVPR